MTPARSWRRNVWANWEQSIATARPAIEVTPDAQWRVTCGEEQHNIAMRTKARKRSTGSLQQQNAGLRKDVREAIDRVWPDGIVELSFDPDESYFCGIHPKLSRAFHRISHALPLQEREAEGGPMWWDNSDPEEDPPDEQRRSRSYHSFFVSPEGAAFTYETETEGITESEFMTEEFEEAGWGDGPPVSRISGIGRTGWVVAVSLAAPFAVIELPAQPAPPRPAPRVRPAGRWNRSAR